MTSEVPSLAHVLETFAYHVSQITHHEPPRYGDTDRFGLGLGGFGGDCPLVSVQVKVKPCSPAMGDPWGIWAQVSIDGKACGNRCGGYQEYARLCAPVIAWVAAYHAKRGA